MEHLELPMVIHGFEPVMTGMRNRDIEAAYRAAGRTVGRVLVREPMGHGIISGAALSQARVTPGIDGRGTEPAVRLLDRLSALRRPRNMAEAAALRELRELCRQAISVLGPDAEILHGTHCRRKAA